MYKKLAISVLLILVVSQSPVVAQSANFELVLIIPSDVSYYDSIAQAIKQDLSSLLVDVIVEGSPRPVYQNDLRDGDYDMALFSLELVNKPVPALWSLFSPDSAIGGEIFQIDESRLDDAGVDNPELLLSLLEVYRNTPSQSEHIEVAKAIQQIYNEDWLLDMSLASTVDVAAAWNDFSGYDVAEGVLNSLFLGAEWQTNPEKRVEQERTTEELHVGLLNHDFLRNPLFYAGPASFESAGFHFSTAFLLDKDNEIHPNLVTSFIKRSTEGGSSTWTLSVREDAFWSDGQQLTARDLKFTYDLASFPWMGVTTTQDWSNLIVTTLLDDFTLQVTFDDNAYRNQFTLATQYIVPEHILNQTVEIDGQEIHPYNEVNPTGSLLWSDFAVNPVSAGPFVFNPIISDRGIVDVFEKNPTYWSPSVYDSPNQIFNSTLDQPQEPYFFSDHEEVSIDNLVLHVTSNQAIDPNTLITTFLSGSRDVLELDTLPVSNTLASNPDVAVQFKPRDGGGITVLFNTETQYLRNFELRKAIIQAIDRTSILNLFGIGHQLQESPISTFYTEYYDDTVTIPFDFDSARDTFRQLGYEALEGDENLEFEWPWQRLPLPITPFIAGFGVIILLRRRS
ncbi:MAG: ABC transporter substrate-binding protein [Candidatus Kariarchaeaceae archaeon]|jgi:ABC-type transport system substrate-binding protein